MLEGRSMYIWNLGNVLGVAPVSDAIAKAQRHKLSSLWVKVADGATDFDNVVGSMASKLRELVRLAHAASITVAGYHVPHCETSPVAIREAQHVTTLAGDFGLDGIVVDNEDGASYFRGGAAEATAYGKALRLQLGRVNKFIVMSSNDIVSGHLKSQAAAIAPFIDVNGPQVYYGGSSTVQSRLDWAIRENAPFPKPMVPVGAAFVSTQSDDGGCKNADACGTRAEDFIRLVSQHHHADPAKYPGYGFWNWEEAPAQVWDVLNRLSVFV